MAYQYKMSGLDYVYLRNGFQIHETEYGRGISIERADALDLCIAGIIITSHARLRGQEVRFLRSLLQCSQTELAICLGVMRVTVARWEGAPTTPIPGPADRVLRLLTANRLLGVEATSCILEMLPEITDSHPEPLYMIFEPAAKEVEPSLPFPNLDAETERWRDEKRAA